MLRATAAEFAAYDALNVGNSGEYDRLMFVAKELWDQYYALQKREPDDE